MEIRITLEEIKDNEITDYSIELSNHGKNKISLTTFYDKDRNSVTIYVDKEEFEEVIRNLCGIIGDLDKKITELNTHRIRQIDENRKISRRLDELEILVLQLKK